MAPGDGSCLLSSVGSEWCWTVKRCVPLLRMLTRRGPLHKRGLAAMGIHTLEPRQTNLAAEAVCLEHTLRWRTCQRAELRQGKCKRLRSAEDAVADLIGLLLPDRAADREARRQAETSLPTPEAPS